MARSKIPLAALVSASLLAGSVVAYSSDGGARAKPLSRATPTFVISGRGWGHGVGMAQWGAYGYAQRGWTYDKILAHYYTGTTLGPAPVARVRVMLAEGRRQLTVGSEAPFTVRDGIGQVWHLAAGEQTFGPGLLLRTTDVQQPQQLPAPLAFLPGSSPLRLSGRPYRGQLLVSVANGSLRAVNSVGLEGYLFGVVPSEMPNTWLPEALKVQAVAARSYALAVRKTGSWFDLYSDTRSQVYLGIADEKPSTTAAVQATAGRSCSTEAVSRRRISSRARVGAPQPPTKSGMARRFRTSSRSPTPTTRSLRITAGGRSPSLPAASAECSGPPGRLMDVRTAQSPSGLVRTVTAVGARGEATLTGSDVRRALDLRSTWFRIGVLSLATPDAPVTFGGRVSLNGVARNLPAVGLEQRRGRAKPGVRPDVSRVGRTGR